ncbi:hypothetical protein SLOPH_565 [Spraguea lophii 42_110]|uniref:Uncharacterized protein n=1 Tax=Spraguea lophii (strain 42_110) TaxID=1358809 RepID=S7XPU4_SPRLO|nr:hypothetical protein SLOPH_565 [Spraguea lophii 42_110]
MAIKKSTQHWTTERHLKKTRSTEFTIKKETSRIPLKEKHINKYKNIISSSAPQQEYNLEFESSSPEPPKEKMDKDLLIKTPQKIFHPLTPESKLEIECSPRIKNYRSIRKLSFAKN